MKPNHFALYSFCLAALLGVSISAQAADVRLGLVAYWQLEGTDGLTTPDATPLSNHLSVVGMSSGNFTPGQFGNAAALNGSSTYMMNLHSPDPSITGLPIYAAGTYTITMWVKGPPQTARYIYTEGSTASTAPLFILQTGQAAANNAKLDIIIRPDSGAALVDHRVSTAVVFDDTWHHVAWVDDRGSVRLYIDGVLDPANFSYTPSGTFTLHTSVLGTLVRTTVHANMFNGSIDDVALWKRALSEAEVQEVMANSIETPIPLFPAVIVADPQGSTNRVGDRVTLAAVAEGATPIAYQWFKDGVEIPGATAVSLSLSNLIAADSGDYTLRVSNNVGTNTSAAAVLLVVPDPTPNLRQGIVSYWPLDEQLEDDFARPTMDDLYGNNDFKVVSDQLYIDLIAGVQGNAASYNGVEQYSYREGGFPTYSTPSYSIAMWVRGVGSNQVDRKIFSETSTNNNNSIFSLGTHATGTNGTLRVLVRNSSGVTLLDRHSTRTPLDGNWHHIAWTDDNGRGRLYIDGVLDETSFFYTRSPVALDTTTMAALLRASGSNNFFTGVIDEIGAWSRIISLTEIQEVLDTGIPAPINPLPPAITLDPADQSVFTRANVTLSFSASGAGPLSPQWRRNGVNLGGETNATLVLSNVSLSDGGDFDVVVTNAVGSVTSQVATVSVTLRPVTTDLKVDFNNLGADNTPLNTEIGFSPFALPVAAGAGPFTTVFGGAEVTLSAVGGINMQSRRRAQPVNSGAFTEERLLQDFVFAPDTLPGQGLDVAITFLEPNQPYTLTIWSYDNVNNGRFSDWSANGSLLTNNYTFTGSTLPTDNLMYRFSFPVVADAQGTVRIEARRGALATAANNVFINALQLTQRAALRVGTIELNSPTTLRLTINNINPLASHRIEEKTNIDDAVWTEVAGAVFGTPVGNSVEVTIPRPDTTTRFYQVVEIPMP